jgi:transcription antitermination factor NusG
VLQTHRGAEALVVEELANQNFASLLPTQRLDPKPDLPGAPRRHRKRHELPRLAPAFPGYLFVLFDRASQPWRAIHSTRGVKRLFSTAPEAPTPVPVGVVERLMARLSKSLALSMPGGPDEALCDGAIVTVLAGPFERQEAIVIRGSVQRGEVRVRLLASGWEADVTRGIVAVVS